MVDLISFDFLLLFLALNYFCDKYENREGNKTYCETLSNFHVTFLGDCIEKDQMAGSCNIHVSYAKRQ
jgi:hypothetical protein